MLRRENPSREGAGSKCFKKCKKRLDGNQTIHYTYIIHLGFATVLRFSPHFEKWSPGLQYRYATPPSLTPGDGKCGRQGTSLLHIAGEKTGTSAPWAKSFRKRGLFFMPGRAATGGRPRGGPFTESFQNVTFPWRNVSFTFPKRYAKMKHP